MLKKYLFLFAVILFGITLFVSCSGDSTTSPKPDPKVKIISPNGGDIVQMGQTIWVRFDNELSEAVAIHVYKGQDSIDVVDPMITAADSIQWLIPVTYDEGFDYRLKIVSTEDPAKYDFSDANFTIAPAGNYIMVTSPNGGGILLKGSVTNISWITNIAGTVRIDLYKNGTPELVIYNSQINDGSQGWTIPGTLDAAADYKIMVQSIETPAVYDYSDHFFCIATYDNTQKIAGEWDAVGVWAKWATIWNFNADGTWTNAFNESGTWEMVGNGLRWNYNDLDYAHYLGVVDGNHMEGTMVNLQSSSTGTWYADRIIPELTAPNGGEVWMRGTTKTITWNPAITVNVVLSLADSIGVVQQIATVSGDIGTYDWVIPNTVVPGVAYRIRLAKEIDASEMDESDNYFCISSDETVDIIGEWESTWTVTKGYMLFNSDGTGILGSGYNGNWTLTGNGLKFVIDYYFTNHWIAIVEGDKFIGRFVDGDNEGIWEGRRKLEVTTPNGGEFYEAGDVVPITWATNITADYVNIALYENGEFSRTLFANNINNYSRNWTVPADLTTSTKYKIRITSTTSDIFDESDNYFTIDAVVSSMIEDENFDDGTADNWAAVEGTWAVVDGLYTAASDLLSLSSAELDSVTGNFVIEAKMKKISGTSNFYGININGDTSSIDLEGYWNNAQMLLVNPNGQYGFWTCVGGSWTGNIGWTANAAVNAGFDTWNILKIIVDNSSGKYHLFFNGQYINTVVSSALSSGKIGLVMFDESKAGVMAVDYVKISRINKSALDGVKLNNITDFTSDPPTAR